MTRVLRKTVQLSLAFLMIYATLLQAQGGFASEKQKIEALMQHVEAMQDAQFVRNGVTYNAQTAAKLLRGKWARQQGEIQTARDFIEKVASVSSTSGKPYLIKFRDKEINSSAYLLEVLQKLEKSAAESQPSQH